MERPLKFAFNSRLGLSKNQRVRYVGQINASARIGFNAARASTTQAAGTAPAQVITDRRKWKYNPVVTDIEDPDTLFTDEELQEYLDEFGVDMPELNAHQIDIETNHITSYYMLIPEPNYDFNIFAQTAPVGGGTPNRPWGPHRGFRYVYYPGTNRRVIDMTRLANNLAGLAFAVLKAWGFIRGSFWAVQVITQNGATAYQNLRFQEPTLQDVFEAIFSVDGDTSAGDLSRPWEQPGTYLRVMIVNPSTGACGKLPPELEGRTRAVWNPPTWVQCAAASLVVGAANRAHRSALKNRSAKLTRETKALESVVQSGGDQWSFEDCRKGAEHLGVNLLILDDVTYVVLYSWEHGEGESEAEEAEAGGKPERQTVCLVYRRLEKHYFLCYRPGALNDNKRWCADCKKLLPRSNKHYCDANMCRHCGFKCASKEEWRAHRYDNGPLLECGTCHRDMPEPCLDVHIKNCTGEFIRCKDCKQVYRAKPSSNRTALTPEQHRKYCGQNARYCPNCLDHKPKEHRCVISKNPNLLWKWEKIERTTFWAVDLEAMADTDNMGAQVVSFASAREILKPMEHEAPEDYNKRHMQYHESNDGLMFDSLNELCRWLLTLKNAKVLCHNGRGYDFPLIERFMRYQLRVKTTPIYAGLKLMTFKVGSVTFIDTLNLYPVKLADFPNVFKLQDMFPGFGKEHFPHAFNTVSNKDYRGPLPCRAFYTDDPGMREWHDEHKKQWVPWTDKVWDIREREAAYCLVDTKVLAMCAGAALMASHEVGVCIFDAVTSASYALKVMRAKFLPDEGLPTLDAQTNRLGRKALKGGRTGCGMGEVSCKEGEEIRQIDVMSMYPWAMSKMDVGVGEPTHYYLPGCSPIEMFGEDERAERKIQVDPTPPDPSDERPAGLPPDFAYKYGLVCCDMFPPPLPKRPRMPYLGATDPVSGKFVFDWLPKRAMCITLLEYRRALELGYTSGKIYSVILWEKVVPELFKDFVLEFLFRKMESDPPRTAEEADALIAQCIERHGRAPDRDKLMGPANPGLRAQCKLVLNSSWGKLVQKRTKKTDQLDTAGVLKLLARMEAGEIELLGMLRDPFIEKEWSMTYHELTRRQDMEDHCTNVVIGCYTTAWGRDRLYDTIGDPDIVAVYWDTDCCHYVANIDDPPHPCVGTGLGDYESEVPKGVRFTRGVYPMPKVYCVWDEELAPLGDLEAAAANPKAIKSRFKGFPIRTMAHRRVLCKENLVALERGEVGKLEANYNVFVRKKYGGIHVIPDQTKVLRLVQPKHIPGGAVNVPHRWFNEQEAARPERPVKRPRTKAPMRLPPTVWGTPTPYEHGASAADSEPGSEGEDDWDAAMEEAAARRERREELPWMRYARETLEAAETEVSFARHSADDDAMEL